MNFNQNKYHNFYNKNSKKFKNFIIKKYGNYNNFLNNKKPINKKAENKKINNRLNNIDSFLKNKIKKEYLDDENSDDKMNKYFSYINLKNFFFNYKTNKDIIYHRYLRPEIYLEKGDRECILILNEWGYPPFGGGENWILDTCRLMNKKYNCYMLCFRNQAKDQPYSKCEIINLEYCKIIKMEKNLTEICKIIYSLKPKLICHQGVERIYAMKIANTTNVPFVTGFCFWNDMIHFGDNSNVNMINKNQTISENYNFIRSNSYTYCASNFMNDILVKNSLPKIPVIETISYKENYDSPFDIKDWKKRKFVSILNIHELKGGKILLELIKKLNLKIPLLLINTERLNPLLNKIINELKKRNNRKNINVYHSSKIDDIRKIYDISRIILIPSIVDETFCRVGYEAMMNGIPTLSTDSGNLRYLLKNYADFLNPYEPEQWINKIESLYFNKDKCLSMSNRTKTIKYPDDIYKKYLKFINNIDQSKFKLHNKRVGIMVPWADQGLGIQGRELYITLKKLGFDPYVFSFKPYLSTLKNKFMQVDKNEWIYDNIHYSENNRENITPEELMEFVHNTRISKILIPELCYSPIFKTLAFLKLMNIKLYGLVNIETTRINELTDHLILDKILTNNMSSYEIMKNIFDEKVQYLGFGMNHPFLNELKTKKLDPNKIIFCTFGGLNSLTRKNINSTIRIFECLEKKSNIKNWELHIYIQGNELADSNVKNTKHIFYHIGNMSYKEVINTYLKSDITIHLGDHEGLGLGFYESLSCYTPLLTLNCYPNCEIVQNNKNGWLIDCMFENFSDNNMGIVRKGKINNKIYYNKVTDLLTIDILNTINVIENCNNLSSTNFENKLKKFLI